ncbi:MAG TPA: hypothetical protein DEB74_18420 [Lachnospiraceae bacterium]|nr:hypothetical protein [Lachnospiraceae bacterium]
MNILAIGAHFDDIELGCGGALAKHVMNGDRVIGFVATNSEFCNSEGKVLRTGSVALQEAKNASNIIGYELLIGNIPTFHLEYEESIHIKLLKIIEGNNIDLIYTHWTYDAHHDHRNIALSTLHVARHINRLVMYRSNWYASEESFRENCFVDITNTWITKEKAIRAYKSELNRTGESWITYFKQEAINNGLKMGTKYAESFQIVKWVI